MKNNVTIEYVDCGESIWMLKKDWETLKVWFQTNKGGQMLEEFKSTPTTKKKVKLT